MKRSTALRIAKYIYKDMSKRNGFTHIVGIAKDIKRETYNKWADIIQEETIEL